MFLAIAPPGLIVSEIKKATAEKQSCRTFFNIFFLVGIELGGAP
jgi:hypothetical protein